MSDMIERLADVIRSGYAQDIPSADIARKVIESMREPTREMVERAWAESDDGFNVNGVLVREYSNHKTMADEPIKNDTAYEVWQAMIDQALAEQREKK